MMLLEADGKALLRSYDIAVPTGVTVDNDVAAEQAAASIGAAVVKAQVPAGGRGKAGGVVKVTTPHEAGDAARGLLGAEISGHEVRRLLVEQVVPLTSELYAAVLDDTASGGPLVLVSTAGGVDIEETSRREPQRIARRPIDIRRGFSSGEAVALAREAGVDPDVCTAVGEVLTGMYRAYIDLDAQLVEINPLAVSSGGDVLALDCKMVVDESALSLHEELREPAEMARSLTPATALERRAREAGYLYMELDGSVGILANGAGLTMATLDAVAFYGGRPANFLEIGGANYSRATEALRIVLDNPRVTSLLINFCGAFARTDVMMEGVIDALEELRPDVPVFYSVHGTGEEQAVAMVRDRLGAEPFDTMEEAVRAAVGAAREVEGVRS